MKQCFPEINFNLTKADQIAAAIKEDRLNLDNKQKLDIYSLYKQANFGDCNSEAPSMLKQKERAKHSAYMAKKGLSKEDAMRQYVDLVKDILKN